MLRQAGKVACEAYTAIEKAAPHTLRPCRHSHAAVARYVVDEENRRKPPPSGGANRPMSLNQLGRVHAKGAQPLDHPLLAQWHPPTPFFPANPPYLVMSTILPVKVIFQNQKGFFVKRFCGLIGSSPKNKWNIHYRGAGSSRSFTALRKDARLCCGSRLRKGQVFAYVGSIQSLKDLKGYLWLELLRAEPFDTRSGL